MWASITRRTDGPAEQIMPGFGAHLDPKVALLRAVTEMNQMLSSPLLGLPEKGAEKEPVDPETAHWLKTATTANQPYLLPAEEPRRTAVSHPPAWTDDVADDVRVCQALVERAGLEMLVLDQTRPEVGLQQPGDEFQPLGQFRLWVRRPARVRAQFDQLVGRRVPVHRLPPDEREAWSKMWADVRELREQTIRETGAPKAVK